MSGRILFIAPHRPGRNPSQRFRFEQYLGFLRDEGWDVTYSHLLDEKGDRTLYTKGNLLAKAGVALGGVVTRLRDILRADSFDVIFVHREAIMMGTTWFEKRMAASGAKLVFDFDDAIWVKDMSAANQKLSFLKRPEKTAEILSLADIVFAGNDYLAEYARQYAGDVRVIPTTIDTDYHLPAQKSKTEVCIGWTGSKTTVKHFEAIIPVLAELKSEHRDKISFRIIADREKEYAELGTHSIAWSAEEEIAQLQPIDIGLMPLPDDEWAKGKCGFKALQYLAVGAPAVVSPIGVNTKIVEHGVHGYHASDRTAWYSYLNRLIGDKELRKEMGENGRKWIESAWSVDVWKKSYVEAFESLRAEKILSPK